MAATSFYNLSLAHLEKFEYQAYNEAKSSADRLAPGVVAGYDRWRFDSGDYAVVDLGLSRDEVWRKFAGVAEGVAERNVLGAAAGRRRGALCDVVREPLHCRRPGLRARGLRHGLGAGRQGLHRPLLALRDRLLPPVPPGQGRG